MRTVGGSIGISIMQALAVLNTQAMHQSLAERMNGADPVVAAGLSGGYDLQSVAGLFALNHEVTRQALMVAYLNDFRVMVLFVLVFLPVLLFIRPPRVQLERTPHAMAE